MQSQVCWLVCVRLAQDHAAVKAALTEPWSNGQTTKLKLVKRQM
jgi:transposase